VLDVCPLLRKMAQFIENLNQPQPHDEKKRTGSLLQLHHEPWDPPQADRGARLSFCRVDSGQPELTVYAILSYP